MVRETRHLWVGNLPDNISEEKILEHFKRYGRVQSVKFLSKTKEDEVNANGLCATIAFIDIKSASKAHSGENKVDERTLKTQYYEPSTPTSSAIHIHERNETIARPSPGGVGGVSVGSGGVSVGSGGGGGGSSPATGHYVRTTNNTRYTHGMVDDRGGGYDRSSTGSHYYLDRNSDLYVRRTSSNVGYHEDEVYQSRGRPRERYSRSSGGSGSGGTGYAVNVDRNQVIYRGHNSRQHYDSRYSSEQFLDERLSGVGGGCRSRSQVVQNLCSTTSSPPRSNSGSSRGGSSSNRNRHRKQKHSSPLKSGSKSRSPSADSHSPVGSVSVGSRSVSRGRSHSSGGSRSRSSSSSSGHRKHSRSSSSSRSSSRSRSRSRPSRSPSVCSSSHGPRNSSSSSLVTSTPVVSGISSTVNTTPPESRPAGSVHQDSSSSSSNLCSSNTSDNCMTACNTADKLPLGICIKNLPVRSSDSSLKDGLYHEYKKHGRVTGVRLFGQGTDRYAIVCFKKHDDVEKSIEVSKDKSFFGCKIEVTPHEGFEVDESEFRQSEAEIDPKATRTLFIGNLEKETTTQELRSHFELFGEIIEIDIKKQASAPAYGFIQYSDISAVVKAIRKLDSEYVGVNRIKLGFGKSMPTNCVWIDGLSDTVSEKFLTRQLNRFGPVTYTVIDRQLLRALVFFESVEYAQAAVPELRGRSLCVNKKLVQGKNAFNDANDDIRVRVDFASRECQVHFFEKLKASGQTVPGDQGWETYSRRSQECDPRDERFSGRDPRLPMESYNHTGNNFNRYDGQPQRTSTIGPLTSCRNRLQRVRSNQPTAGRFDHDDFERRHKSYDDSYNAGEQVDSSSSSYEPENNRDFGLGHRREAFSAEERVHNSVNKCKASPRLHTSVSPPSERSSVHRSLSSTNVSSVDKQNHVDSSEEKTNGDGLHEDHLKNVRCARPQEGRHSPSNAVVVPCGSPTYLTKDKYLSSSVVGNHSSSHHNSPCVADSCANTETCVTSSTDSSKDANKRNRFSAAGFCPSDVPSKNDLGSDVAERTASVVGNKGVSKQPAESGQTIGAKHRGKVHGVDAHRNDLSDHLERKNRLLLAVRDRTPVRTKDVLSLVSSDVTQNENGISEVVSDPDTERLEGIKLKSKGDTKVHTDLKHLQNKKVHLLHLLEQLDDGISSSDHENNENESDAKKERSKLVRTKLKNLGYIVSCQQPEPLPLRKEPIIISSEFAKDNSELAIDPRLVRWKHHDRLLKFSSPNVSSTGLLKMLSNSDRPKRPPLERASDVSRIDDDDDVVEADAMKSVNASELLMKWRRKSSHHSTNDSLTNNIHSKHSLLTIKSPSEPGCRYGGDPTKKRPMTLPLPQFATEWLASLNAYKASPKVSSSNSSSPRLRSPSSTSPPPRQSSASPEFKSCGVVNRHKPPLLSNCEKRRHSNPAILVSPPSTGERIGVASKSCSLNLMSPPPKPALSPSNVGCKGAKDSTCVDSSSDSEQSSTSSPNRPSFEERIRALDEKFNKWSGSSRSIASSSATSTTTTMTGSTNTANSSVPSTESLSTVDQLKKRQRFTFLTSPEIRKEPSDIVKSLLAKSSIFDQDSKRLENIDEKYEPKEAAAAADPTKLSTPKALVRTKAAAKEFSPTIGSKINVTATKLPSPKVMTCIAASVYEPSPTLSPPHTPVTTTSSSISTFTHSSVISTVPPIPYSPLTPLSATEVGYHQHRRLSDNFVAQKSAESGVHPCQHSDSSFHVSTSEDKCAKKSPEHRSTGIDQPTKQQQQHDSKNNDSSSGHTHQIPGASKSQSVDRIHSEIGNVAPAIVAKHDEKPKVENVRQRSSSQGSGKSDSSVKSDFNNATSQNLASLPSSAKSQKHPTEDVPAKSSDFQQHEKADVLIKKEIKKESSQHEVKKESKHVKREESSGSSTKHDNKRKSSFHDLPKSGRHESDTKSEPESKRPKLSSHSSGSSKERKHSGSAGAKVKSEKDRKSSTKLPSSKSVDKSSRHHDSKVESRSKHGSGKDGVKSSVDVKQPKVKSEYKSGEHKGDRRAQDLNVPKKKVKERNDSGKSRSSKDKHESSSVKTSKSNKSESKSSSSSTGGKDSIKDRDLEKEVFFDDEPIYFSMYDKVKARSSHNQIVKDQSKDLDLVRKKFDKLKETRAHRESKVRSGDYDSSHPFTDEMSDISSPEDGAHLTTPPHLQQHAIKQRKRKFVIESSSDSDASAGGSKETSRKKKSEYDMSDSDLSDLDFVRHRQFASALKKQKAKVKDVYDSDTSDDDELRKSGPSKPFRPSISMKLAIGIYTSSDSDESDVGSAPSKAKSSGKADGRDSNESGKDVDRHKSVKSASNSSDSHGSRSKSKVKKSSSRKMKKAASKERRKSGTEADDDSESKLHHGHAPRKPEKSKKERNVENLDKDSDKATDVPPRSPKLEDIGAVSFSGIVPEATNRDLDEDVFLSMPVIEPVKVDPATQTPDDKTKKNDSSSSKKSSQKRKKEHKADKVVDAKVEKPSKSVKSKKRSSHSVAKVKVEVDDEPVMPVLEKANILPPCLSPGNDATSNGDFDDAKPTFLATETTASSGSRDSQSPFKSESVRPAKKFDIKDEPSVPSSFAGNFRDVGHDRDTGSVPFPVTNRASSFDSKQPDAERNSGANEEKHRRRKSKEKKSRKVVKAISSEGVHKTRVKAEPSSGLGTANQFSLSHNIVEPPSGSFMAKLIDETKAGSYLPNIEPVASEEKPASETEEPDIYAGLDFDVPPNHHENVPDNRDEFLGLDEPFETVGKDATGCNALEAENEQKMECDLAVTALLQQMDSETKVDEFPKPDQQFEEVPEDVSEAQAEPINNMMLDMESENSSAVQHLTASESVKEDLGFSADNQPLPSAVKEDIFTDHAVVKEPDVPSQNASRADRPKCDESKLDGRGDAIERAKHPKKSKKRKKNRNSETVDKDAEVVAEESGSRLRVDVDIGGEESVASKVTDDSPKATGEGKFISTFKAVDEPTAIKSDDEPNDLVIALDERPEDLPDHKDPVVIPTPPSEEPVKTPPPPPPVEKPASIVSTDCFGFEGFDKSDDIPRSSVVARNRLSDDLVNYSPPNDQDEINFDEDSEFSSIRKFLNEPEEEEEEDVTENVGDSKTLKTDVAGCQNIFGTSNFTWSNAIGASSAGDAPDVRTSDYDYPTRPSTPNIKFDTEVGETGVDGNGTDVNAVDESLVADEGAKNEEESVSEKVVEESDGAVGEQSPAAKSDVILEKETVEVAVEEERVVESIVEKRAEEPVVEDEVDEPVVEKQPEKKTAGESPVEKQTEAAIEEPAVVKSVDEPAVEEDGNTEKKEESENAVDESLGKENVGESAEEEKVEWTKDAAIGEDATEKANDAVETEDLNRSQSTTEVAGDRNHATESDRSRDSAEADDDLSDGRLRIVEDSPSVPRTRSRTQEPKTRRSRRITRGLKKNAPGAKRVEDSTASPVSSRTSSRRGRANPADKIRRSLRVDMNDDGRKTSSERSPGGSVQRTSGLSEAGNRPVEEAAHQKDETRKRRGRRKKSETSHVSPSHYGNDAKPDSHEGRQDQADKPPTRKTPDRSGVYDVFEFRDSDDEDFEWDHPQHHGTSKDKIDREEPASENAIGNDKADVTDTEIPVGSAHDVKHGKISITIRLPPKDNADGTASGAPEVVKTSDGGRPIEDEQMAVAAVESKVETESTVVAPQISNADPGVAAVEPSDQAKLTTRKSQRLLSKSTVDEVIEDVVRGNFKETGETVAASSSVIRTTRSRTRSKVGVKNEIPASIVIGARSKSPKSEAKLFDGPELKLELSAVDVKAPVKIESDKTADSQLSTPSGDVDLPGGAHANVKSELAIKVDTIIGEIKQSLAEPAKKAPPLCTEPNEKIEPWNVNKEQAAIAKRTDSDHSDSEKSDVGKVSLRSFRISRTAPKTDDSVGTPTSTSATTSPQANDAKIRPESSSPTQQVFGPPPPVMKVELPKVANPGCIVSTRSRSLKDLRPERKEDDGERTSPIVLIDPVTGFLTPVSKHAAGDIKHPEMLAVSAAMVKLQDLSMASTVISAQAKKSMTAVPSSRGNAELGNKTVQHPVVPKLAQSSVIASNSIPPCTATSKVQAPKSVASTVINTAASSYVVHPSSRLMVPPPPPLLKKISNSQPPVLVKIPTTVRNVPAIESKATDVEDARNSIQSNAHVSATRASVNHSAPMASYSDAISTANAVMTPSGLPSPSLPLQPASTKSASNHQVPASLMPVVSSGAETVSKPTDGNVTVKANIASLPHLSPIQNKTVRTTAKNGFNKTVSTAAITSPVTSVNDSQKCLTAAGLNVKQLMQQAHGPYSLPSFESGVVPPTGPGGSAIAQLLQNPQYMQQQYKEYLVAAAHHQAGAASPGGTLIRPNTPAVTSLSQPTPPHTPTPPSLSIAQQSEIHGSTGMQFRPPGSLVVPSHLIGRHPSEINAYVQQQMMYAAAGHPSYSSGLHAEIRAQQEAQARNAALSRLPYPGTSPYAHHPSADKHDSRKCGDAEIHGKEKKTAGNRTSQKAADAGQQLKDGRHKSLHPNSQQQAMNARINAQHMSLPQSDNRPSSRHQVGDNIPPARSPHQMMDVRSGGQPHLIDARSSQQMRPPSRHQIHDGRAPGQNQLVDMRTAQYPTSARAPGQPHIAEAGRQVGHLSIDTGSRAIQDFHHSSGLDTAQMAMLGSPGSLRPPQTPGGQLRQLSPHIVQDHQPRCADSPANVYHQMSAQQQRFIAPTQQRLAKGGLLATVPAEKPLQPPPAHQATNLHRNITDQPQPAMPPSKVPKSHYKKSELEQSRQIVSLHPRSQPPLSVLATSGADKSTIVGNALPGIHQSIDVPPAAHAPSHLKHPVRSQPHPQTPPAASQVPPQGDSLLTLLQRYPLMWQGMLALKNDQAAVQMHFVSGNRDVGISSLPTMSDGGTPPLRIAQRMRLEQPQLEGVARRMQMEREHCMLLALPCGRDQIDVLQQSNNLHTGFISYFQQKQAAGVVNVAPPGSQQAAYVVHIFPSCEFSCEVLARIAPDLLHSVADIAHLLIIILTV